MKNILNKYHSKIDKMALYILVYCIMVKALIHILYFVENEVVLTLLALLIPFALITRKHINYLNKILHIIFGFRR